MMEHELREWIASEVSRRVRHLERVGSGASRATYFAWMSMTEWTSAGATLIGEDQEVWSPDRLGPQRG